MLIPHSASIWIKKKKIKAVDSLGVRINSHEANLKNLHFTWTAWEWVRTKKKNASSPVKKFTCNLTKHSSFLQVTISWDQKGWNHCPSTGSGLVHGAFKTDSAFTMLYSSSCEHSREEAKVAQTAAGVKLFPQVISALSIVAYDTCKLVNISSTVALMTVKACYFESNALNMTMHWLLHERSKTSVTNVSVITCAHSDLLTLRLELHKRFVLKDCPLNQDKTFCNSSFITSHDTSGEILPGFIFVYVWWLKNLNSFMVSFKFNSVRFDSILFV